MKATINGVEMSVLCTHKNLIEQFVSLSLIVVTFIVQGKFCKHDLELNYNFADKEDVHKSR